jgi:hypothetical protein
MEQSSFQGCIQFSENLSRKRIDKLSKFFDIKILNKIIGLVLFLLGGNRIQISNFIGIPVGTFFSFLRRLSTEGISALFDKRSKNIPAIVQPVVFQEKPTIHITYGEKEIPIRYDASMSTIRIEPSNAIQFKVLILSLVQSGMLKSQQASELLQISQRHVLQLCKNLSHSDVAALIDKRGGHKKDYAFTSTVKAQLIQQYITNVVTGGSTTSSDIAQQVNKECNTRLSARTFRHHIIKMGLDKIKHSLPSILEDFKKNSKV